MRTASKISIKFTMMKVITLLLVARYVTATELTTMRYTLDRDSEQFTRNFEKHNDGSDICEPGYTGSDCSLRKCPYSLSFMPGRASEILYTPSSGTEENQAVGGSDQGASQLTSSLTFSNSHAYKECGGRGLCDRTTGRCKCFSSYTGTGCRRQTCPNDCSGHGICEDGFHSLYGRSTVEQARDLGQKTHSNFWSAVKFRSCKCDRGYRGFDCSLRTCPHGDDPETECSDQLASDKQQIKCTGNSGGADSWFTLAFKDHLGGKYSTRPIVVRPGVAQTKNAQVIQKAIESLPDFAVPTVEVDIITASATYSQFTFDVDFKDGATTNKQALLSVDTTVECEDSSQPKFIATAGLTCTVSRLSSTGTLKEAKECGGRGLCDSSTGICSCFTGYYGDSCSQISTYV